MTAPSLFCRLTLILILTAGLEGCITEPVPQEPPLLLPEHFSMSGKEPIATQWWTVFNDTSLNKLIEQSLGGNFSLLAARQRIHQAWAAARKAGASLRPELDLEGGADTNHTFSTNSNSDSFLLGVAASYELDLWGRLEASRTALEYEARATASDFQVAALTIAGETATTWFTLIESEQQVKLLTQQRELNKNILELLSIRFRTGTSPFADILQQRQLVEQNDSELASLRAEIKLLHRQLILLLGNLSPVIPDRPDILPEIPQLPATGIVITRLTNRPDVKAALLRLKSSNATLAAAVADRLPRISISAEFSSQASSPGDLFSNWFSNLGANLIGPLLDGGKRKAEQERVNAITRRLWYSYGQTMLEAINEVEEILIREQDLLQEGQSLSRQLEIAAQTVGQAGNRYRQGLEDYQRVLSSLLNHQSLQRQLLKNHRKLLENRIGLYRALSGPLPDMGITSVKLPEHTSS